MQSKTLTPSQWQQTHPEFENILDAIYTLRRNRAGCVILDCWGMLDKATAQKLGFDYIKFGSGKG